MATTSAGSTATTTAGPTEATSLDTGTVIAACITYRGTGTRVLEDGGTETFSSTSTGGAGCVSASTIAQ
jgi:hypothetical protein